MAKKTFLFTSVQLPLFALPIEQAPAGLSPSLPSVAELQKKRFALDEAKILRAGFSLVRYDRAEKKVLKTCKDPLLGWFLVGVYPTFAAAERQLKECLADPYSVEVTASGTVMNSNGWAKLRAAGFESYRAEGIVPGHGTPHGTS